MPHILAFDEGTTSARTVLYDETGQRLLMRSLPLTSVYPNPGWVEQDADEIWNAQIRSAMTVLAESGAAPMAIGITNQRETTVVWERKTGRPLAPAIVWQCRRTSDACRLLDGARITAKTGLVPDAYFSATKIQWILEHSPDARAMARDGEVLFGTVDSWLIWKLTNGAVHVTDRTNASRTMLMDLASSQWDEDLLGYFDIPRAMLPRIVGSSEVVGATAAEHLGREVPIAGIAGDQQAALAGQACFRPGLSKNTYGTGCFALMHTGDTVPVSKNKLLATAAAQGYAVEGSIFVAGAAVQWLRDKLGLLESSAESEVLARSVPDTGGVYIVPAFVGLGAPHWNADARGLITGLTLGSTRAHLVRATLEAIAFQTRELVDAMQADSGASLKELRVDGGAAQNDFLMQFQADMLGCRIVRPVDTETTALGAAYLAGLATGVWKDTAEVEQFWRADKVFEPEMDATHREELYAGWKKAVAKA
ncbi:MAG TPA: glycerol kinase GlpK [Bryobacteraceae bacterium]|nr:glycerol kinase GlpK [Bryobacteraceae bacterium]